MLSVLNIATRKNETPLFVASSNGHLDVVEFLLFNGVNPNIKDNNQMTPLIGASSKGFDKIVETLLEKGANINDICFQKSLKNNVTYSSLHISTQNNHF